jgi:hypothetical protein
MAEAMRGISEPELQFIPKIVCLDISRHAELIPMIADRCLNRGATDLRPLRTRRSTGSELRKIYEFHNQSLFVVRYVATCLMNLGPTFAATGSLAQMERIAAMHREMATAAKTMALFRLFRCRTVSRLTA